MQTWLVTAAAGSDPTSALLTYGPLGIFAAVAVVFMRTVYADIKMQRDAERAEVKRLNALLQEQVVAALVAGTAAVQSSTELLRDLQRDRRPRENG